jgi:hypothetical protein
VDSKGRREEGALVDSLPRRTYNPKHSVWGGWRAKGLEQPGGLDFATTPSSINYIEDSTNLLQIFNRYGYILTIPGFASGLSRGYFTWGLYGLT